MDVLQMIREVLDLFWASTIGVNWVVSVVHIKWSCIDAWVVVIVICKLGSV